MLISQLKFYILVKNEKNVTVLLAGVRQAQMGNSVKLHRSAALVILVCMAGAVRTSVQVSTVLVLKTTPVLVVSMNMTRVLQELVAMVPPALTMVLDTPASVHMVILVSLGISPNPRRGFFLKMSYEKLGVVL